MEQKGFFGKLFDLSFSEFITISIIKVLYIIAIILSAIGALVVLIGGFTKGVGAAIAGIILAPLVFLLYVLIARVWMELIMVLFKIAENTGKMAGQDTPQQTM
jgi:hypothetical protein